MAKEGRPFKGVIFFGLMLTEDGPKVLEFNARFGDPEAQVVLPRMKNDIIDVMLACVSGTLGKIKLEFEDNAAVCVMLGGGAEGAEAAAPSGDAVVPGTIVANNGMYIANSFPDSVHAGRFQKDDCGLSGSECRACFHGCV